MAKNVQEARVDVTLNGEAAKNEIKTMKEQLDEFTKELLRLQKTPVGAMKPGEVQKMGELRKETQKLEKQIKSAEEKTEAFARTLKNINSSSLKDLQAAARRLSYEVKELAPGTQEFIEKSKQLKDVNTRIVQLRSSFKGVVEEQGKSAGFFKRLAGNLSNYFGAIMIGYQTIKRVAQGFMEAYKTISNFEQANANLASILGATSDQMEKLEKAAIALGSSTRYSASQVTGLQTELAKLGFGVKEITDMSPAVLNFAGSVGTDLASAAALAGVALRSFNLGSEQTEDALGTMAVACNKSALSFTYLQNSFSTIAPVAKTYGLSLKDTIALLGTLANAGFDASSAATATRNILLNLSDTNGKLAKALGGSVHSFEDIMGAMKKLRDQGVDLNTTLELTDKRSVAAFNTFLDGAESAMTLRGELENVDGELQTMADQRANTVEGAIDGMKSAWEGLVLSFRNSTGTFRDVFNGIAEGIRGLTLLLSRDNRIGAWAENAKDEVQRVYDEFGPEYFEMWVESRNKEFAQLFAKAGGGRKQKRKGDEWMGFKQAVENVDTEEKDISLAKRLDQIERAYDAKVAQFKADMTLSGKEVEARIEEAKKKHDADRQAAIKKESERMKQQAEEKKKADADAAKEKAKVDEKEAKKEEQARQQAYNKRKAQMAAFLNYQEKSLKVQWLKGEMGEAEYNSTVYQAKAKYYEDMLALARKYGQDDTAIRDKMLDDHIKALEAEKKRVKEEMEEMARYQSELNAEDESRFGKQAAKNGISDQGAYDSFQEKIWAKANEIKQSLVEDSARTEYETQMKWIEKLHKDGLLSDEEFEKAKLDQKLGFAAKIAQEVNRYAEMASNFANALKESETAKMEAEYQAQLTAAGDNAEERERIEAEYEQKKLDMQKKYADVDMVINIAKAIASGALAAVEAFAAAGGNPVLGGIFAAIIAATTAAEIATIVAQRNAIKNTSVSSSSSSSSIETGKRTLTGYSEGGDTPWAASDDTPVGIVHANEWVAPAWMKRREPVLFANLERYRKAGSHGRSGSASRGFADGGNTGNGTHGGNGSKTNRYGDDIYHIVKTAVVDVFESGAVRVVLVRKDLTELDNQNERFKNITSR